MRIKLNLSIIGIVLLCLTIVGVYYYDVVAKHKTLTTPYGLTTGVMGDLGAYGAPKDPLIWPKYGVFLKDMGSNAWQGVPLSVKSGVILRSLHLPLWNDNLAAGKPLAANYLSDPFFPPKVILYLFHSPLGWDMYLLFRFSLGMIFMYYFLRLLGLSRIPSIFGGIAFTFSGIFVIFQNIQDLDVGFLFPMAFWAVLSIYKNSRGEEFTSWKYLGIVAAFVTILLANIPEPMILIIASSLIFWLFLLVKQLVGRESIEIKRYLTNSLKVFVPVLLLVTPLYLLNLQFTLRAITTHPGEAKLGLQQLWSKETISLVLPFIRSKVFFLPDHPISVGSLNYFGLVGTLLALVGFLSAVKERGIKLFLLFITTVVYLKIYGSNLFHLNDLIGNLPGFERVIFVKYAQPLLSLGLAALAAFGLSSLLDGKMKAKEVGLLLTLVLSGVFAASLILLRNRVDLSATLVNLGMLLNLVMVLTVIIFFLLVIWVIAHAGNHKITLWLVVILGLAMSVELWLYIPRNHRPTRYDDFLKAPYLNFLLAQPQPYRIFGLDRILIPQFSSAFNLDDIRDLDGLYDKEYYRYITTFISPGVTDRFTGLSDENTAKGSLKVVNNPFFDLMNVKYVISNQPINEPDPSGQYKLAYNQEMMVYENQNVLPRAFIVRDVEAAKDSDAAVRLMQKPGFSPQNQAVVIGADNQDIASVGNSGCSFRETTNFEKIDVAHVKLTINSPSKCFMLYSDSYYPGWIALVDGRETAIYQSDLMFKGVFLDQGEHIVEFIYKPKLFYNGLLISLIGLILVTVFVVNGRRSHSPKKNPQLKSSSKFSRSRAKLTL